MLHERSLLNANVLDVLYNYNEEVAWIYRGQEVVVASKQLSINGCPNM